MKQTRLRSAIESCINIAVGFGLSLIVNYGIMTYFGYDVHWAQMGWLAFWMTLISFIRSYCLRRVFNWWDHG